MPRLALAILAVAIAMTLIAVLARSVTQHAQAKGGLSLLTTGGMMQKLAFFMLLCLIVYVSVGGVG